MRKRNGTPSSSAEPGSPRLTDQDHEPNAKIAALEPYRADPNGRDLTTNQGLRISDNQNSLRAGERGPTLLEDFIMREKITHFDHERIPERVVHARGAAAHGYFQVYESMASVTKAGFLSDPSVKTPVFVRFSTVGGSRGSADTPRDVRGFAVKFYTPEGNYDLVGNNMPVFFIQDAIKFPDFVHAVKPEPHNEIPQASSARDTLWDFVSLTPESSHMMMWLMSDRSLPRSFSNMEGFGVHTFRFVNANDESHYVKFHWKPIKGAHSLVWEESQKIMGFDPDFQRRDLYDSIEGGDHPEWELGVQIFGDDEADAFDFDILDATKLIPEELIPVRRIGKMTLDRNPDSYFAETEQVAFCTTHLVPGIDFTNDPLLQGRNFSYLDTQITRLGGPNFHEIPINRPVCPFSNGQRDGAHRMTIDVGNTSYDRNTLDDGFPKEVPSSETNGGFASNPDRIDGYKLRVRSASFSDHYSQATLFWKSMSAPEKQHIIDAFSFELAKLTVPDIRMRIVEGMLANIDADLTAAVCANLGVSAPQPLHAGRANGARVKNSASSLLSIESSPMLSLLNPKTGTPGVRGRKVAILAADGVVTNDVTLLETALLEAEIVVDILAPHLGMLEGDTGPLEVDEYMVTMPSVVYDAIVIADGTASVAALDRQGAAASFINDAYRHGRPSPPPAPPSRCSRMQELPLISRSTALFWAILLRRSLRRSSKRCRGIVRGRARRCARSFRAECS